MQPAPAIGGAGAAPAPREVPWHETDGTGVCAKCERATEKLGSWGGTWLPCSAMPDAVVCFDGAARAGGMAGSSFGVSLMLPGGGLDSHSAFLGFRVTNNEAEGVGLVQAITLATGRYNANSLVVKGDSELLLLQMAGYAHVRDPRMAEMINSARKMLVENGCAVSFKHIPRAQNQDADKLANEALDAAVGVVAQQQQPQPPPLPSPAGQQAKKAAAKQRARAMKADRSKRVWDACRQGAGLPADIELALVLLRGVSTLRRRAVFGHVSRALAPLGGTKVVVKVELCIQPDGNVRHNVWVPASIVKQVVLTLNESKLRRRMRWFAVQHVPWAERRAAQAAKQEAAVAGAAARAKVARVLPTRARWATLNLHGGLDWKSAAVMEMVKDQHLSVLALQETRKKSTQHLPTRLSGFHVFERAATADYNTDGLAGTGLAIAVLQGVTALRVGCDSPFFMFVRVEGAPFSAPCLVGTMHVPSGTVRKTALAALAVEVTQLRRRYSECGMLLMGDFNGDRAAVQKWIRMKHVGLVLLPTSGSAVSFHRKGVAVSAIDHVMACEVVAQQCAAARVLRAFSFSDHWPVVSGLRHNVQATVGDDAAKEVRFKRTSAWLTAPGVVRNGREQAQVAEKMVRSVEFDALAQVVGQDPVDTCAEKLTDAVMAAATSASLLTTGKDKPRVVVRVPKRARLALQRVEAMFVEYQSAMVQGDGQVIGKAREQYLAARASVRQQLKAAKQVAWQNFLLRSHARIANDPAQTWRWVNRVSGRKGELMRACWAPLKDANGVLVTDKPQVAELMVQHFKRLYGDERLKSVAQWEHELQAQQVAAPLAGLNQQLAWSDLVAALRRCKPGTAPGPDSIPPDVWKLLLVLESKPDGQAGPETRLGVCLFVLLSRMLQDGYVPDSWCQSTLAVIPKPGGDTSSMTGYRGLALGQTALKLLCSVLAANLSAALEDAGVLSMEQFGFRKGREAIAAAATLVEVGSRRLTAGLGTAFTFIDFTAAYDSVPHNALFVVLSKYGVTGAVLAFIQALYRASTVRVRYPDGTLSGPIPQERGLRQGCPLSPILFVIFIDSLARELRELAEVNPEAGVVVPGVASPRFVSALFADDVVLAASSVDGLRAVVTCAKDWARRHHMVINASKSGTLLTCDVEVEGTVAWAAGGKADYEASPAAFTTDLGVCIPLVSSYKYLGLHVDEAVSLKAMVAQREQRASAALASITPFLRQREVSMHLRARVLSATAVATGLYGAEVWGGSFSRTAPIERVLLQGLRMITGVSARGSAGNLVALHRDLHVPPVHASATGMIARVLPAFTRVQQYWPALLLAQLPTAVARSWASRVKRVQSTKVLQPKLRELAMASEQITSAITDLMWRHSEQTAAGAATAGSFVRWYDASFASGGGVSHPTFLWQPSLAKGYVALHQLRVRAFPTLEICSKFVLDGENQLISSHCVSCAKSVVEDEAHILLHCEAYSAARELWLQDAITGATRLLRDVPAVPLNIDLDRAVVTLLLGGGVRGIVLFGWCAQRQSFVAAVPPAGAQAADPVYVQPHDTSDPILQPVADRVARYLIEMKRIRRESLAAAGIPILHAAW